MHTENDPKRKIRAVHDLSQDVQPARDLWQGIESQLRAAQSPQLQRKAQRPWLPAAALAAGVALVAIGIGIGGQIQRPAGQPVVLERTGTMIRASLMDPDYQRRRDELLRTLPAKLAQLPPDSQQRVNESLRSIQQAMQNIETELGHDSGNALLQALLISTCEEELRVLIAIRDAVGVDGRV